MNLKKSISFVFCLISLYSTLAQKNSTISNKDFNLLIGSWQGSLTYIDYSSNKPYTMQADIDIKQIGTTNKYTFANTYPKEPNANSMDTMVISKDGKMINEQIVKSIKKFNDRLEIITEVLKTDGNENKPALLRHTHIIDKDVYINRKDVQFVGQKAWIKRNEYKYKKKPL